MRTWKAIALFAAIVAACDDPIALVPSTDGGASGADTGPAVPPDAATTEDVGVPDTGPRPDTGISPVDAATPPDAASPEDAGPQPDAGPAPDTGAPDWDGGGEPDVGTPPDAAEPGLDAGEPPDSGPPLTATGQPCTAGEECTGGLCLGAAEGWPASGYCSKACILADPVGSCPSGARCRDITPSGSPTPRCLDECAGGDPCASGFTCTKHGNVYTCEP